MTRTNQKGAPRRAPGVALWLIAAVAAASCDSAPPAEPPEEPKLGQGACYVDTDCSGPEVCFDVECLRSPNCRDASSETPCPTDCVGFCADPNRVLYCATDSDCPDDYSTCRSDRRFCVDDRRTAEDDCIGWCVGLCFLGVVNIESPETGLCYTFPDSCMPPGFPLVEQGVNCVSL
jgi:hypothetical protein